MPDITWQGKLDESPLDSDNEDSPEYYIRKEKTFNELTETRIDYEETTKKLQQFVKDLWYEYFKFTHREPEALNALKQFPVSIIKSFFEWMLRRRLRIRAYSTLQTYYNVLCLVRSRETGIFRVDEETKRKMTGARQQLAIKHKLRMKKKDKPVMRVEDLFEILKTILVSLDMVFDHERDRIQTMLWVQLVAYTGNRPAAISALCYKNFKVALIRDPDREHKETLIIDVTAADTKGYLGEKDANTLPLPPIRRERCLLLCLQTLFLGLAFADGAFANNISAKNLYPLKLRPDQNELELKWKESMETIPIFRRPVRTVHGIRTSLDSATTAETMRTRLKKSGAMTGIDVTVLPYSGRRGFGEALDNSSQISVAQRNLLMQHASSRVFEKRYLPHHTTADVLAAFRGLDPQTALLRAATGLSRTIDKRRPWRLEAEERKRVQDHPKVKLYSDALQTYRKWVDAEFGGIKAIRDKAEYKELHEEYQQLVRNVRNEKNVQERAYLEEIKASFRKEQPVKDVQRQLDGFSADEETNDIPTVTDDRSLPERLHAISLLLIFLDLENSPREVEEKRRTEAVEAVASLCRVHDGHRRTRSTFVPDVKIENNSSPAKPVMSTPLVCKPLQCSFCLHDEQLDWRSRVKPYSRKDSLKKHLNRQHLKHLSKGKPIACPECGFVCDHPNHLRNHGEVAHGILI